MCHLGHLDPSPSLPFRSRWCLLYPAGLLLAVNLVLCLHLNFALRRANISIQHIIQVAVHAGYVAYFVEAVDIEEMHMPVSDATWVHEPPVDQGLSLV